MKKYITGIILLIVSLGACLSVYITGVRSAERIQAQWEIKYWEIANLQEETMFRNASLRESIVNLLKAQELVLPHVITDSVAEGCYVLRLSETFCMSCHENNIKIINEHFNKDNAPQLFVIGSYPSNSAFKSELSYIPGAVKGRNLPELNISPIDGINTPYIFKIGASGKIERICFLLKGEEDILETFLETIPLQSR